MTRRIRAWLAGLVALIILAGGLNGAAQATPARGWPVTPATVGSLYGTADAGGITSVRSWGSAIWCYVQPTADADVEANLDRLLAPTLDAVRAVGGTATVTIGHPAPWVFGNHPRAVAPTKLWACGDHASGVSIPAPAALKRNRDGTRSAQTEIWRGYVGRVVDYIAARYGTSLRVILEVWNEPNLSSGLNYRLGIPGAASTMKQAVRALHRYESIAYSVIRSTRTKATISLGSSALTRPKSPFTTAYLRAHDRKRRIDSIHVNVYGFTGTSRSRMTRDWDARAADFRSQVASFPRLRSLPMRISEANLNLVNRDGDNTNARSWVTRAGTQRRLATATQMNAYYNGYRSVHWLVPWRRKQAAVHIQTKPGNAARDALAVLQTNLEGRTLARCKERTGVRICTFTSPSGTRLRVLWRMSGRSTIRQSTRATLVTMTGRETVVRRGDRVKVRATPIILR